MPIMKTNILGVLGGLLSLGLVSGCAVDVAAEDPTEATVGTEAELRRPHRPRFDVLGPEGKIRGKTYEQWSAAWWRWVWGGAASTHPTLDTTGEFCGVDQAGPVFFLAGTFGGAATRACTIPRGKLVFFPIIAASADNCGVPPADQLTVPELIAYQEQFDENITAVELTVDGTVIGTNKDELSPFLTDVTRFSYSVPEEDSLYDLFGMEFAGRCSPSFSVGYFVMLDLAPGMHTLHFAGAQANGFSLETTYTLDVR
jgi:hypothetical protein